MPAELEVSRVTVPAATLYCSPGASAVAVTVAVPPEMVTSRSVVKRRPPVETATVPAGMVTPSSPVKVSRTKAVVAWVRGRPYISPKRSR